MNELEPDLIVLDEFQRFRDLLHIDPDTGERTEAGELADVLFRYEDARVLLLSATPYKPYTRAGEDEADHYRDFIATAGFLLDSNERTAELEELLGGMRRELLSWHDGSPARLSAMKERIEQLLRRVMCRTERLAATPNRDGMLVEVPPVGLDLGAADLEAFVATAKVADALDEPDQLELWKSAPYLLNLMDSYKLKRRLGEALGEDGDPVERQEVEVALKAAENSLLSFDDLRAYEALEPQNGRLRALAADTLGRGAWRLLWLPPSLPYYEPAGSFADPGLRRMTKKLVFSAWAIVPKAIATLLSYEAERQMTLLGDSEAVNNSEARDLRGSLLEFKRSGDRLGGLPVLALLYPSFSLAERVNIVSIAAGLSGSGSGATQDEVLRQAAEALRPAIERVTAGASTEGRVDERWYWAAPLLLDVDAVREVALEWLEDERLASDWPGVEADRMRSDTVWREHVDVAAGIARDPSGLGPPPADLAETLAQLAVAGPGVVALRALARVTGDWSAVRNPKVRTAAGGVAWSLRSLFNSPEAAELIRGLGGRDLPYWRQVLRYCGDGCIQAVLDEYAHVLRDAQGLVGDVPATQMATDLSEAMSSAIAVRTSSAAADEIRLPNGRPEIISHHLRMRFAMRFGDQQGEDDKQLQRAEHVREAFNSPFWPFVLASTSVGQEGLDFHPYCHAVVHWNLPSNPVDLEQREGRVHRYKGHAVRRNLAAAHGHDVLASSADDVWTALFNAGLRSRPDDATDLQPFWITDGEARIERHVLAAPLSRDEQRLAALKRSLTLYRMVFGQARQDDLVEYLAARFSAEDVKQQMGVLRMDLGPKVGSQQCAPTDAERETSLSPPKGIK